MPREVEQSRRNLRDLVGNCLTLGVGNYLTFDTFTGVQSLVAERCHKGVAADLVGINLERPGY